MTTPILQLFRNASLYSSRDAAKTGLEGIVSNASVDVYDGMPVLARYTNADGEIMTLVGFVAVNGDKKNITVFDYEGSAADIEALKNEITAKIEALDATVTSTDGTHVAVKVTETDGIITAVNVTETDIASAAALSSEVDRAKAAEEANANAIAVLNGTETTAGSVAKAVKDAVEALDSSVAATAGYVLTGVTETDGKLTAKTEVELKAENVAATASVASDTAVAVTGTTVAAQIASLAESIKATQSDAKSYSIEKATGTLDANVKEAWKLVDEDGTQVGETIKIYKDGSLKSVALSTEAGKEQTIVFTYDIEGAESTVELDLAQAVFEADFGDGLQLSTSEEAGKGRSVSVKIDTASEDFLTVSADGVKLSGVQNAIDTAVNALDATVTSTDGTHVAVKVTETDGKITAVNVTETDIASAAALNSLTGKTITAVTSANNSITATLSSATDGTKSVDLVTDASKIKMNGFTAATSGFTAVTEESSVVEAVKAVESYILSNEEVISAALNDLESTKAESADLTAEIEARKRAIAALDADKVGGAGKVLTAISETDGKISATAATISAADDTITVSATENAISIGVNILDCGTY